MLMVLMIAWVTAVESAAVNALEALTKPRAAGDPALPEGLAGIGKQPRQPIDAGIRSCAR
mgnify:CR=1 FL=1